MPSLYAKGRYAEIYLAKILAKHGYAVLRAPASGSKAKRFPYPDLIAFLNGRLLVFEVKRRAQRQPVYLSLYQYNTLKFWQSRGAEVYVAVRYDSEGPDFRVVPLDCAEDTGREPKVRYRISVDAVFSCGKPLLDII